MAEDKKVEHDQIGNIDLEEIIAKYGSFSGSLNRAMDFGGEDPEQVLINLIVCDGDPNRGNRESLLSTDLKKVGVANAKHPTYRFCTLIISCTKFKNTVDSDDNGFIGVSYDAPSYKKAEPKKEKEENTIKPRKVLLKDKIKSEQEQEPPAQNDEEEDAPPEGVVSESRTEKIVMEKGKKKRIIKIVRTMEDGSKETETIKEAVEDDE